MKSTIEILKDYNITKETRHHSYDCLFSKLPEILRKYGEQIVDKCAEEAKTMTLGSVWMGEKTVDKESILRIKNELK